MSHAGGATSNSHTGETVCGDGTERYQKRTGVRHVEPLLEGLHQTVETRGHWGLPAGGRARAGAKDNFSVLANVERTVSLEHQIESGPVNPGSVRPLKYNVALA